MPHHTFADLALAIDDAFGRWELGRRREFTFADGSQVGEAGADRRRGEMLDYRRIRLQRLEGGERFGYRVDDARPGPMSASWWEPSSPTRSLLTVRITPWSINRWAAFRC